MPNWCENNLIISGTKKHLAAIKLTKFDFNRIIPMPKEFNEDDSGKVCPMCNGKRTKKDKFKMWCKECEIESNIGGRVGGMSHDDTKQLSSNEKIIFDRWVEKYGTGSWYEWSCQNWGTKWNCSEVQMTPIEKNELSVKFLTAWCVPIPILLEISRKYNVKISNQYNIEGNESGIMEIEHGELLSDIEIPLNR